MTKFLGELIFWGWSV